MSFEWARARMRESQQRERERALGVQGAGAPGIEMVLPLAMTFWT